MKRLGFLDDTIQEYVGPERQPSQETKHCDLVLGLHIPATIRAPRGGLFVFCLEIARDSPALHRLARLGSRCGGRRRLHRRLRGWCGRDWHCLRRRVGSPSQCLECAGVAPRCGKRVAHAAALLAGECLVGTCPDHIDFRHRQHPCQNVRRGRPDRPPSMSLPA